MEMEITKNKIERIIDEVEEEFLSSQGLILTESDLKCHLFRKLYDSLEDQHQLPTLNPEIKGSPLHTELAFYDEPGEKLIYRPDISIINTNNLSILHSLSYTFNSKGIRHGALGSKQYSFGGDPIIMELKFCRNKKGINKRNIISYIKDIEKIKHLQSIAQSKSLEIFGYFIVFNKTDLRTPFFDELYNLESSNLKIIYKTGSVKMGDNQYYIQEF